MGVSFRSRTGYVDNQELFRPRKCLNFREYGGIVAAWEQVPVTPAPRVVVKRRRWSAEAVEGVGSARYHPRDAPFRAAAARTEAPLRRLLALWALLCISTQALAVGYIQPGVPAPNFTKNQLADGGGVGPSWTLWNQRPKVVILFVLGSS